ncbi:Malate-2H(+)/Na(+)-lactate antiporter [Firmicutes bacterium ASF500]|nr:Malate-2H(+)/Na(+)-lactate antiporter [Firmicutes bacterium ASF500]
MDLLLAFGVFLACVMGCMVGGLSLGWALAAGFVCFFIVGVRRGTPAPQLWKMAAGGMAASMKVLRILLLLGLLTALWRAGGTVAFFVWAGVRLITPETFVLVAFGLSAVFSLAFGSSFGVVGTAGVILMTIARSGGANLAVTAGAVMSGIYVGERLSPASSSAALAAAVSGVDQRDFQLRMWRTTPVPLLLTLALYGVLSAVCPIQRVDAEIVAALEEGFSLTWPTVLPAAALLLLPWLKVSAMASIAVSCVLSAGCALLVQKMP